MSAAGLTLIELMANLGGRLGEQRCATEVAAPLLSALATLHARGIVHRDIKPEHILCTFGSVKLVDFVEAAVKGESSLNHRAGQFEYQAPEVLSKPSMDDVFPKVSASWLTHSWWVLSKASMWSTKMLMFCGDGWYRKSQSHTEGLWLVTMLRQNGQVV